MTPRNRRFVDEYLIDLDAARAARKAGYGQHSAAKWGAALLAQAPIRAAIREAMAARAERTGITADRVLREYARLVLAEGEASPGGVFAGAAELAALARLMEFQPTESEVGEAAPGSGPRGLAG